MSKKEVRILVLDDHQLFAEGLRGLLLGVAQDIQIDIASEASPFLKNLSSLKMYDLILTDLQMPSLNGLIFLKAIQTQNISLRVAVISGSQSESDIETAIALGACGYIPKDSTGEKMLAAVTKLLNGERYLPEEMFAFTDWVTAKSSPPTREGNVLSERQIEVIKLIRDGMSNPVIADVLGVSLSAVKRHVEKAFKALEVNNRTTCVREAERRELI